MRQPHSRRDNVASDVTSFGPLARAAVRTGSVNLTENGRLQQRVLTRTAAAVGYLHTLRVAIFCRKFRPSGVAGGGGTFPGAPFGDNPFSFHPWGNNLRKYERIPRPTLYDIGPQCLVTVSFKTIKKLNWCLGSCALSASYMQRTGRSVQWSGGHLVRAHQWHQSDIVSISQIEYTFKVVIFLR